MKKALLAVMAIALVIGFAGCTIFGPKAPYHPLKTGNKWDYTTTTKTTMVIDEGEPIEVEITSTTVTEVLGEKETTGDEPITVWEIKSVATVDTFVTESFSYVDVDKDYIYYYKDLDATEEWFKIPSDPVLDDTWTTLAELVTIDSIVDTDTFTTTTTLTTNYKVVADAETANDYENCLKIEVTPPGGIADYDTYEDFQYWAKDVGNVMTVLKSIKTEETEYYTSVTTIESETKLTTFTEGS